MESKVKRATSYMCLFWFGKQRAEAEKLDRTHITLTRNQAKTTYTLTQWKKQQTMSLNQ